MATIYDIAKKAGVSPATVSNAYNRPEQMKPETRARILETAATLGYQPNMSARALAGGKSQLVGLLVSDIRIPYVANVTRGIEDRLTQEGFIAVVSSTDGDGDKTLDLVQKLKQRGVGGFILVQDKFGISEHVAEEILKLEEEGTTVIIAGHEQYTCDIAQVVVRGQVSAKELTTHLIDLGHRDIALLAGFYTRGEGLCWFFGYQEAMMRNSIPIRPELTVELEGTPGASREAVEHLMALPNPPTAIFAMNEVYALGVIDYVVANQVKVPEELSIVSYDYQVKVQRVTPSLTSIVIASYDTGWQAAELFLASQESGKDQPRVVLQDHSFENRGSTAPPRDR